jgi:hypothetical protein
MLLRTPATADVTITVTVELPNRTLTESVVLPMPTAATWAGPLGCADEVRTVAERIIDQLKLTLPQEWHADTTGRLGRAVRAIRRTLHVEAGAD